MELSRRQMLALAAAASGASLAGCSIGYGTHDTGDSMTDKSPRYFNDSDELTTPVNNDSVTTGTITDTSSGTSHDVDSLASSGGVDSFTYVDADGSGVDQADVNSGFTGSDGVIVHGGTLTVTGTITVPAGKTLITHCDTIQVDGATGIGGGTMTTLTDNLSNTRDAIIDARGDRTAVVSEGGVTVLDANTGGSNFRDHIWMGDSVENVIDGWFETRGGRSIWVWDVDYGQFHRMMHVHANDSNNQRSAVFNSEGCRHCQMSHIVGIGDSGAVQNLSEVADSNKAGQQNQWSHILGYDVGDETLELTNEQGSTVENVTGFGGGNAFGVQVADETTGLGTMSDRTGTRSDGLSVSNVTRVGLSSGTPDTDPAVKVTKDGDGGRGHAMSFTGITAVHCRLFDFSTLNSPTETNTISNLTFVGSGFNSGTQTFSKVAPVEAGWFVRVNSRSAADDGVHIRSLNDSEIHANVTESGNRGVYLQTCDGLTGTLNSNGATAAGLDVNGVNRSSFNVSLLDNGGWGINAATSDKNRYDGVVDGNTSGQATGTGAASVTDLV